MRSWLVTSYKQPSKFFLYVILAAAGSAVGSIVLYLIGYTGGEVLLRKRLSAERFGRIHASFEKHEFWALMFPAMLPPPTPFKLFVLAAAAFEMRFSHFLAAIFAGRFVRFLILALLTLKFGPQFVEMTGSLFRHHLRLVLLVVAPGLLAWLWWWRRPTKANGLPGPSGRKGQRGNQKISARRRALSLLRNCAPFRRLPSDARCGPSLR